MCLKSEFIFLNPQKLALTSPTSGGRSVGIVRSRTQATEFSSVFSLILVVNCIRKANTRMDTVKLHLSFLGTEPNRQ
jgi:hypothetical protein